MKPLLILSGVNAFLDVTRLRPKRLESSLVGAVVVLGTMFVSQVTIAAAPTPTTTYRVLSAKPANLDMSLPAQPYVIRVTPKADACRFGIFVIAPGVNAGAIRSVATSAISQNKWVAVEYTKDANDFCVVNSMALSTQTTIAGATTLASAGSPGNPNLGVYDGYHNAFATAHKSAFRDFGQGKFDESVDPITGRLSLTYTDVVVPGPNGLDIRVIRNYISPDAAEIVYSLDGGRSLEPQFNGFGWHVIANFGGIRGMLPACSLGSLTGEEGATSSFDGFYMRAESLPQWINANGRPEPLAPVLLENGLSAMLPATGFSWRTASGVNVECGVGEAYPVARLADGTVIEMNVTNRYLPIGSYNAFPSKITDRWGNWIAFEYDMTYAGLVFLGGNATVQSGHMAGSIPLERITSSDGREVRFVYESGLGTSGSVPVPLTEKILKRIEYGSYKVEYTYDRVLSGGVSILASTYGKYFLKRVDLPDGLNWGYTYLPPVNIQSPLPGQGLLNELTYPNGGIATYEWGGSKMTAVVPAPYGPPLSKTFQLRKKSTSDGGVWRYSYTDMSRTSADEATDPIPTLDGRASGAGAVMPYATGVTSVNLEAGRVTGPSGIEVFHNFPRYSDPTATFDNFQNIPSNYTSLVETWRLGRLLQHTTYPLGTVFSATVAAAPLQTTTQTYVPVYFNVGFFGDVQSVLPVRHAACSDPRCPAGDTAGNAEKLAYLVRPVVTTIKRGTNSYVTTNSAYMSYCGRTTVTSETGQGQRNRSTTYVFDRTGFCQATSQQVDENGARRSRMAMTLTADKRNVVTETQYGPLDSGGLSKGYTYHSTGEVASTTDARGYKTYFSSYRRGVAQAESHPVGTFDGATDPQRISIARVVDDFGRITSETDGEGRTTRFTYNGMHKPTSVTLPRVASAIIGPFVYGLSSDAVARGGRIETVGYDGFGRVTSYSNGSATTNYRYDAAGRRTFVSYPGSVTLGQAVAFDALDRPTKLTEPSPANSATTVDTNITYDDNARTVTLKNARGYDTVLTMEAFGDPTKGWVKSRNSPAIGLMTFDRNVFGQIERISHVGSNLNREFVYDANKGYFLAQEMHPELGGVFYDRDNNGNATGKRIGGAAGPLTSYAYDGQNRLVTTAPPSNGTQTSPAVTNVWNRTGQIKRTVAGDVSRDYAYDENNNLTSEQVNIDGVTRTLAYEYDALDSLSRLTYPSGKYIDFNPDILGRPQQVGSATSSVNVVSSVTYWPSGMPKKVTFANGVVQDFTEQARPLVSALSIAKSATSLMSLGFGYDEVGNQTSTTDALSLGYARTATYDMFDRIISSSGESFTYEGVGDIKTKSGAIFNYGANRLLGSTTGGAGNRTYQYDSYGNATTDRAGFAYAHDALNSLRQVKVNGNTTASYDYDGHQHLAKKVATDGITHYLYGKSGRLFGEYVPASGKHKEYFYLGSKLVGQVTN